MTQKLDSKTGNLQRPVQDLDMAILNAAVVLVILNKPPHTKEGYLTTLYHMILSETNLLVLKNIEPREGRV
jgi:hypothetical protein